MAVESRANSVPLPIVTSVPPSRTQRRIRSTPAESSAAESPLAAGITITSNRSIGVPLTDRVRNTVVGIWYWRSRVCHA